ncbi:MAG: class I SAM-dependent methyltransferase [Candidatus Adiutrix sp.]
MKQPKSTRQLGAKCRWCGEMALTPKLVLPPPKGLKDEFSLATCHICATWQVSPFWEKGKIYDYFINPARFRPSCDPDGLSINPYERLNLRQGEYEVYAQAMAPHLAHGGTVLDIGAGGGLMLSLLPPNLRLLALEPNPVAADIARQRGLTVLENWAEDIDFPPSSLLAVVMNQSLDHLYDPRSIISKVALWLRPGGLLLISGLINPQSWAARVFKENFRLWHPLHQIYPPPQGVMDVLGPLGFRALKWWRPYFNTPFGGFKKFLTHLPMVLLATVGLKHPQRPSPPWPHNTFSLLAQKNILLHPLNKPAPLKTWWRRYPVNLKAKGA